MYTADQPGFTGDRRSKWLWLGIGVVTAVLLVGLAVAIVLTNKKPDATQRKQAAPKVADMSPQSALAGMRLYVDPASNAAVQAAAWQATQPADAALMAKLAAQPTAKWFTSVQSLQEVSARMTAAAADNSVPVLVAYYIPLRDCGQYSAGGAKDAADYLSYIGEFSARIGIGEAIVILEPDALAGIENQAADGKPCLSAQQKDERYRMLREAVDRLKQQPGVKVYVDAGHSAWVTDIDDIAQRLRQAGVAKADGFSLNVSNFQPTDQSVAYGQQIVRKLGDKKRFVIDTSRNGAGVYTNPTYPDMGWCNPPDRALGQYPTTNPGKKGVDAYLYIKYPGESDGQDADPAKCFGGPRAGQWWPDYALGLVQRWPAQLQPKP